MDITIPILASSATTVFLIFLAIFVAFWVYKFIASLIVGG